MNNQTISNLSNEEIALELTLHLLDDKTVSAKLDQENLQIPQVADSAVALYKAIFERLEQ